MSDLSSAASQQHQHQHRPATVGPSGGRGRWCQVRIRQRSRTQSNDNLFCRFPSHTLKSLLRNVVAEDLVAGHPHWKLLNGNDGGWALGNVIHVNGYDSKDDDDHILMVEFLPLEMVMADGTILYASYNGGLLSYDKYNDKNKNVGREVDWVELPQALLPHHGSNSQEDEPIFIRILPAVMDAAEVILEPLESQDYTLLQNHADWIERGGLLSQTSLVYHGQVLEIHLRSGGDAGSRGSEKARAKVIISGGNLQHKADENDNELDWPDDDDDDEGRVTSARRNGVNHTAAEDIVIPPCRRLVADARVIVVDPPSPTIRDTDLAQLWPCPTRMDYGPSMQVLAEQIKCPKFPNPLFGTVLVHPDGPAQSMLRSRSCTTSSPFVCVQVGIRPSRSASSSQTMVSHDQLLGRSLVARVETSTLVPTDCIALHPLQSQTLQLDPTSAEYPVILTSLTHFEVEQSSSRLLDYLEKGQAQIQLCPVRYQSSRASSYEMSRLSLEKSIETEREMDISTSNNKEIALSIESLFIWEKQMYRLHLEYSGDDAYPNRIRNAFIFSNDLVRLLKVCDSAVLLSNHVLDAAISIEESTTRGPRLLCLLPEPTVVPSNLVNTFPDLWRDFNMLLHGPPGGGKTRSALLVAAKARLMHNASTVYYDCRAQKNASAQLENLLQTLTDLIDSANKNGPRRCLIILDNLDEIYPYLLGRDGPSNTQSSQSVEQTNPAEVEQAKVVGDHLRNLLENVKRPDHLALVATCRDVDSVSWNFSRRHSLSKVVSLPLLTAGEKMYLLEMLLQSSNDNATPLVESSSVAALPLEFQLRDLLPKDIEVLAMIILKRHGRCSILHPVILEALDSYIPLNRRSAAEEPRDSFFDFYEDIGGLFAAKQTLVDLVIRPLKFRRIFSSSRIRLPKGILLFGPPGCGKSIIPAGLARVMGLPLILCRGPEILDKYIGASEARVRELFERATLCAPSILFFDEIDSLAPHRGSDLTGVTDRVVNQLLTFLDGVEDVSGGKTVYVVAGSSRPDKIDSALLRPGRLEKHVYVGYPESRAELLDVFVKIACKYPLDKLASDSLVSGRLLGRVDQGLNLEGMPPSEIKAVFDTAQIKAVREHLEACDGINNTFHETTPCIILERHLVEALVCSRAAISDSERLQLEDIYDRFRSKKSRQQDQDKMVQRMALR